MDTKITSKDYIPDIATLLIFVAMGVEQLFLFVKRQYWHHKATWAVRLESTKNWLLRPPSPFVIITQSKSCYSTVP